MKYYIKIYVNIWKPHLKLKKIPCTQYVNISWVVPLVISRVRPKVILNKWEFDFIMLLPTQTANEIAKKVFTRPCV